MFRRIAVQSWWEALFCAGRYGACLLALALSAFVLDANLTPLFAQEPLLSERDELLSSELDEEEADVVTAPEPLVRPQPRRRGASQMLVHADELIYDYENEQVSAAGNVQIYRGVEVLEADRVTLDRRTNRLIASGNARFQASDGNIIYGDTIELTEDFRDGFVESFLVERPDRTRFAAARGRRQEGNITVFESGVYTACEPCKENPEKPPLWQVKAARIIHNEGERVIHYENAALEFFGMPVAYFPYFWHPDPTVKRQTGFLMPVYFSTDRIGYGVNIPYYWALAPNYDLTVSVAPTTRQVGPLVTAEWRHRLMNGSYMIRTSGIFQQDPDAFRNNGALTPGVREFRGSIETRGAFRINRNWVTGWNATLLSDRFYLSDYSFMTEGVGSERSSSLYLTGQGERSHFDLRGMAFIGFSHLDHRARIPLIHPVLDYSKVFDQPVLGGELGVRANLVSLSREEAAFRRNNPGKSLVRDGTPRCGVMFANPSDCLIQGISGDYTRFSTELSWRRTVISPTGMVFKPFMQARADVATLNVKDDSTDPRFGTAAFHDPGRTSLMRTMPAAGMEVRWPFISVHSWGTQVIEPIGQIIVRPDETEIGRFPNEDAHSLIFDDTNLFAIDKYSGYDRVEGGTRANVGVQYTANIHRHGMINVLVGQSYHLFGRNSFALSGHTDVSGRQTGLGLQSGLEHDISDYVARIYYQPSRNLSFTSRFRFDRNNFDMRRFEIQARYDAGHLSLSTAYARYDAQPLIGVLERREAIYQAASLKLDENWGLFGGGRYDIEQQRINLVVAGLRYIDECFAALLSYEADYSKFQYTRPVHRIMLRINLRTIGGSDFSHQVGSEMTN